MTKNNYQDKAMDYTKEFLERLLRMETIVGKNMVERTTKEKNKSVKREK